MIRAIPLLRLPRFALRARLRRWQALHRQRAALANLDDHLRRDIGLSEAELRREAARPPWDAPENWRVRE